ncbi:arsenate reductase family protein [Ulvibacter antarcticus]|uniref:Arsenate reductase n=1 Tax=Ulvibacter antarcticus TaxID=442714 RepID=A0A3L9YZL8_9FLAO|nr:ArsC/Spx/MgsR family protein [Ulvibacter antarcticus]RMA66151.1 arsenate reductase [Ulvibacter antarcticus]
MQKVYYLATCDTCKRIIKEVGLPTSFEKQEIKNEEITVKQLEKLHSLAGSYEALFSKRAKLYKERNLKNEKLEERDYRNMILEHYTFLKRPVIVNGSEIFIGNSKKTVDAAKISINS